MIQESPECEPQTNGLADGCAHTVVFAQHNAKCSRAPSREIYSGRSSYIDVDAPPCRVSPTATMWDKTDARCGNALSGKSRGRQWAEFGRTSHFLSKGPRKERQWTFGIWRGLVIRTQETHVGTQGGEVRTWAIERTGDNGRWSHEEVLAFSGIRLAAERDRQQEYSAPPEAPPPMVRSFYETRKIIAQNGTTLGCRGCSAIRMRKPPRVTHTHRHSKHASETYSKLGRR